MKKDTLTITKPGMVCAVALLCCLLWGSAFPSIKIGYRLFEIAESDSMSQLLFAGYRFSLAGIMVIVIGSFMSGRILCPKCSSWSMVIRLGAVQTIFQYVFFYMGLAHTTGVKSSIITASNVFFAIFLSAVVFREKITPGKMTGCIIGFAGVVLINLTGAGIDLNLSFAGEGAIMLSAFASALSSVLIKRYSAKEDTFTLCGYQFLFGGVVLSVIVLAGGGRVSGFTAASAILLAYMGLISAVAYSLWSLLLSCNPVGKVAIFGFSNPMFGVILSALLLGEKNQAFTIRGVTALFLVCVGICMVNKSQSA